MKSQNASEKPIEMDSFRKHIYFCEFPFEDASRKKITSCILRDNVRARSGSVVVLARDSRRWARNAQGRWIGEMEVTVVMVESWKR